MRLFFALILIFASQKVTPINSNQEPEIKDVVLINSYHPTFKWTHDVTDGVLGQLSNRENYRVSIEFMDSKRFDTEEHLKAFENYLRTKYKNLKINGVICSDNLAFEFYLAHGKEIWGETPITFCGVNNIKQMLIDTTKMVKGVEETINMTGTLNLITTLQPKLDTLIVISDNSLMGKIFLEQFISTVNSGFPGLNFVIVNAVSVDQLGSDLRKFTTKNKAIYLLSLYIPRRGISRDMINEAEFLQSNLDVPTYGNWNFLFGNFIVGGIIMDGYDQGKIAAQRLKQILTGEGNYLSFLAPTPEKIIFDYKQLKKYGLNPNVLPENTEFINKPVTVFEKYFLELSLGLVILVFLLTIIFILLRIISLKNIAEKKLKKSEERLGLAMNVANLGLWDVDFINKTVFLSNKVHQLLGFKNYNDLRFGLDNWREFFHPDDVGQFLEVFHMHSKSVIPTFSGEIRLSNSKNQYKWFSLHGKITDFKDGQPSRMIGVLMDINFQREFENQLKDAKEKAEESDRLKSSFLANMSHEIRTPMNAILGFTDVIISENLSKKERDLYLKLIRNSGESLLNLINDIVDFSKIQSGELSLRAETFDLNVLFDNISLIAANLIKKQNKEVKFIAEKHLQDESFYIITDPFRLEQLIYNLVSNAIKFTDNGEIKLNYKIIDSSTLLFTVADSGKGIAPEHHELIFDRFRQIETSQNNNMGGTGLGLAITKSLVLLMGGEISVDSELNKGSKFSFTINYKPTTLIAGINI